MAKEEPKKRHIFLKLITSIAVIVIVFFALRLTHVILHIGRDYKFCFSTAYRDYGIENVNDDNISEIVYMKNLKHLSVMNTALTNIDFITNFTKLESLTVYDDNPENPEGFIKTGVPSLKNSPNLVYIYLYVSVEDLDFIKELPNLEYLTVCPLRTEITDISGLKNKDKLKSLTLYEVNCSDFSVLLDLPALEHLYLYGTVLPDDIKEELTKKGVKIKNGESPENAVSSEQ